MKHKIWVSTVTHRHGTNSHAAGSEDAIYASLAAYCIQSWDELGDNADSYEDRYAGAYASRGEDGVRVAAWVLVPNEKAAS